MSIGESEKFIALPITYVELRAPPEQASARADLSISSLPTEVHTATERMRCWGRAPARSPRKVRAKSVRREPAYKPGSVESNHSSGIHVAVNLERPTRKYTRTALRPPCGAATFLFGLAPGGVCHANPVTRVAVRSYRTVSPLPAPLLALRRFTFCCTFRGLAPPRRYLAPYPPEPGLSSTPAWQGQRLPGRLQH